MGYTYISSEEQAKLFENFGGTATNTGSADAQIALFTRRIAHLSKHLQEHKKDHSTRRALLRLVGQRRKLLAYIKRKDINRYRALIQSLDLRK
ncbi:MAG TPA: 30S ribosomal protein S15 [Chitinophagales bacterium]|nr:30S ribosomal protein S15 [Chitinophagales bacterium]HRK26455.1 30S ribosomal protein S15 [Chitinophagales bacterium]